MRLCTMETRLNQLWKPLLTQLTVSGAHRNAQCNGTRTLFFFSGGACHFTTPVYNNSGNQKFFPLLLSELQFVADILPGNDPAVSS